jgi:peptidylprolyl isomerase
MNSKSKWLVTMACAAVLGLAGCGGGGGSSGGSSTPVYSPAALVKTDTTAGTGAEAVLGRAVEVYYSIYLYDTTKSDFRGKKVDGTTAGTPVPFLLAKGALIEGWVQGMPGMKVGGKRTLHIPTALAYGDTGQGAIPGGSGLVADIELVSMQGPIETPTALVKTDTTVGTGTEAALNKTLSVNYSMYLYDSSKANFKGMKVMGSAVGTPVSVALSTGAVPDGWLQGVPGMKVGGTRTLLIPASLGYGTAGHAGYAIAPNQGLVAEINLVGVQ